MDDTLVLLEMQYIAIEDLRDSLGRHPTREEVTDYIEGLLDGPKFKGLRVVQ